MACKGVVRSLRRSGSKPADAPFDSVLFFCSLFFLPWSFCSVHFPMCFCLGLGNKNPHNTTDKQSRQGKNEKLKIHLLTPLPPPEAGLAVSSSPSLSRLLHGGTGIGKIFRISSLFATTTCNFLLFFCVCPWFPPPKLSNRPVSPMNIEPS